MADKMENKSSDRPAPGTKEYYEEAARRTKAAGVVTGIQERVEESKEAMEERKRLAEEEKENQERLARALAMQKPTLSPEEAEKEAEAAKRAKGKIETDRTDWDVMNRPEKPAEETSDKK